MKYFKTVAILLSISIFSLTACNESTEEESVTDTVDLEMVNPDAASDIVAPLDNTIMSQPTAEPAQNADGVWHYTCSQGCAGGAGSAVNCATCNNLLVHNTAYHPAPNNDQIQNVPTNAPNMNMPAQNMPEPAQNAAGVWHYTCPSGCSGGSGSASPCGACGTMLAHNSGYHQ